MSGGNAQGIGNGRPGWSWGDACADLDTCCSRAIRRSAPLIKPIELALHGWLALAETHIQTSILQLLPPANVVPSLGATQAGLFISEEMPIRVIAEDPWSWFLLEEDGKLYLDVLVEHGAVSFGATSELSPEQATRYAHEGIRYLRDLSTAMRHKALMHE